MTCELICKCAFNCDQATAVNYCSDNPMLCARRRVAVTVGSRHIPEDLLPDQSDRVLDIVFKNAGYGLSA